MNWLAMSQHEFEHFLKLLLLLRTLGNRPSQNDGERTVALLLQHLKQAGNRFCGPHVT
ncbi:hypothetical protein D3C72_1045340 [compost metagenome]